MSGRPPGSRRAAALSLLTAGLTGLGLFALATVGSGPAQAAGETAQEADRCVHDKALADRRATRLYFACARAAADVPGRLDDCAAIVERRLRKRLDRADAAAGVAGYRCPAGAESLGLDGTVAWPFQLLGMDEGLTQAPPDPGTFPELLAACSGARAGAARPYAAVYSRCAWRALTSEDPRRRDVDRCVERRRRRFLAAWSSEVDAGACPGPSAEEAAARIEDEILESLSRLHARCGDGVVGGFEECDDGGVADGDGCSAECRTEACGRVGDEVRCLACPDDAEPTEAFDGCQCPGGFSGNPGACVDIDECAADEDPCAGLERPCVNLPGTWACAIACTADAFHQALADCGAPSGAIAFDCLDTAIPIPGGAPAGLRDVRCDDLRIDGAGRNITFQLDPFCWRTPLEAEQCPGGLEEDGTCLCPDVDSGDVFLLLRGDDNVVRDLTVRGFFDGIPVRGDRNLVEEMRFERLCDDAFGSVAGGVGNQFRRLSVRDGCDKCSENSGAPDRTDPDPRVPSHFNAILSDVEFRDCRTPVRAAVAGRYLLRDVRMIGGDDEFPCDGPRFATGSDDSRVVVHLTGSRIEQCRRGVRFGTGGDGLVRDTRIASCSLRGLHATGSARVSVEGSTIEGNGGSGSIEAGFGGVAMRDDAQVDLGGGQLLLDGEVVGSAGENSICSNVDPAGLGREVDNSTASSVPAAGNWWCSSVAPSDRVLGAVDAEPLATRASMRVRPQGEPASP